MMRQLNPLLLAMYMNNLRLINKVATAEVQALDFDHRLTKIMATAMLMGEQAGSTN